MAKETFAHPDTSRLLNHLEATSQRSGVSRGQAFEDFLHMTVCSLSGGEMEDQYLAVVQRHVAGKKGKRGCDSIAHMFGELVEAMERTRADILGDLFQGAISYGEAGQFLTPPSVCELMARMVLGDATPSDGASRNAFDPCCGSGRMLLAAAELRPGLELIGQDIDLRCVRMTAINLALRNRYGHVIWGNSLTNESRLVYRTGFNMYGGVIRYARPDELKSALATESDIRNANPEIEQAAHEALAAAEASQSTATVLPPARGEGARRQLDLFN